MASGTVSRQFDLGGPSFAVDAACSGSLVALDQAIAQLRQGTCRIAVVGGVYLNLTPDSLVGFSRLRALSATGVCRPFDEGADGFVLGEGAGAVVIRPLADALADGDRVYAVIKGIGSANDGASPGPLAPTAEGQLRAMRRAYDNAGVAGPRHRHHRRRPRRGGGAAPTAHRVPRRRPLSVLPRRRQGPHRALPVRGGHRGTDQDGPGRPPRHDRAAAGNDPACGPGRLRRGPAVRRHRAALAERERPAACRRQLVRVRRHERPRGSGGAARRPGPRRHPGTPPGRRASARPALRRQPSAAGPVHGRRTRHRGRRTPPAARGTGPYAGRARAADDPARDRGHRHRRVHPAAAPRPPTARRRCQGRSR